MTDWFDKVVAAREEETSGGDWFDKVVTARENTRITIKNVVPKPAPKPSKPPRKPNSYREAEEQSMRGYEKVRPSMPSMLSKDELLKMSATPEGRKKMTPEHWKQLDKYNMESLPGVIREPLEWWNSLLEPVKETTPFKWQQRAAEQAVATAAFSPDHITTTTGSGVGDTSADIIGSILGLVTPQGGGGVYNLAEQGTARGLQRLAPLVAEKPIGKAVGNRFVQAGLSVGAGGATYGAAKGIVEGQDLSGIVESAAKEGAMMVPVGAGGRFVGDVLERLLRKPAPPIQGPEPILGPQAPGRVEYGYTTAGPNRTYTRDVGPSPIAGPQPRPEANYVTTGKIETFAPKMKGQYQVKNKPLEQAITDYNRAIEIIQNHFRTNQLRADEINRIKPELGIDIDELIENIDLAQKGVDISKAAERSRYARVSGLSEKPEVSRLVSGEKFAKVDPLTGKAVPVTAPPKVKGKKKPAKQQVATPPKVVSGETTPAMPRAIPGEPLKPPVGPQAPRVDTNTPPTSVTPTTGQAKGAEDGVRRFVGNTLSNSPKSSDDFLDRLINDVRSSYKKISNAEVVERANARVATNIEKAASDVMGARVANPELIAVGHRLIDEFQKSGNIERAVDVAEKIAELGTKSGQSIQAFSIYNRLTSQGILVHAQRVAAKVNDRLPAGAKEVKVTQEMANNLTDLAATVQNMTGTKQAANNVMDILERAKAGQKLTDEETAIIKNFVQDAKQFVDKVKPLKPREPRPIKDKRVRDNVVSFLEAQEKAALERIAKARGRVSSTPLDIYADYAIVGASRMAKGLVRFADWSEDMVKQFGEEIRPHLEKIYEQATETFNLSTKKVSQSTISNAERITERLIKNKGIGEAEAKELRELAQKVSGLSGDAKIMASQDLQAILKTLERPTAGQKVSTFQAIMQLLNPKTMVRNALGNELFYRVERLNKFVAAPIDWAKVKLVGGERTVTFVKNNQGEYWKNWLKGFQAGWKGVSPEGLTTQYELRPGSFSSKWNPLTYMEKVLGASLQSFDYAGYKRAVNHTLGEMATLDAINRGLKGTAKNKHVEQFIRNADENILSIADEYGRYVTFQDNNLISKGLVKFKRGLNLGKEFGLGDLVIKYPKTPGALLMRALEYSPVGFLRSAYILAAPAFKKGEPNTREVMLALSRAITGSFGMTGMGYFLADSGILSGSASKDKDVRELQAAAGQKQYQVNVTALTRWVQSGFNPKQAKPQKGDTLVSYDWAQPVAIGISMGANIEKNMDKSKQEMALDVAEGAYDTMEGGLNTLVEQSVLQGVKRAFETNPGEHGVMDKVASILSDAPASFVPTLSNQMRQLTDNTRRNTKADSKTEEAVNKFINRLPGFAESLPVDYDTLGRPKEAYQDDSNNIFNVLLNPAFVNKYNPSKEAQLVIDLINKTGDETLAPRTPQRSIKIDGQSVKLAPEEYSVLQMLVGAETVKGLSRINPELPDKQKTKLIEKTLDKAGEKARKQLKRQLKQKGG